MNKVAGKAWSAISDRRDLVMKWPPTLPPQVELGPTGLTGGFRPPPTVRDHPLIHQALQAVGSVSRGNTSLICVKKMVEASQVCRKLMVSEKTLAKLKIGEKIPSSPSRGTNQ